jgi:hypothetical protein
MVFCFVGLSIGQSNWDFQSVSDGNWETGSNWQVWYDLGGGGSQWQSWGLVPDPYVTAGNVVYVNNDITINSELNPMASNMIISSSASLTISNSGCIKVTGTLTNNSGTDGIVIQSTSAGTGSLINNSSGISGTFEQYISTGQWHLLGIPVSSATLNDFDPPSGDGYMRAYETVNSAWGDYLSNPSAAMAVAKGYQYWTTSSWTPSLTGTFNTGNVAVTLSSAGDKWNLISNPYPCAVDVESMDYSNFDGSTVYYYTSSSSGSQTTNGYAYYNGSTGVGSTNSTQYIPPFQGFFVKQTSGTSFNFTNSDKAHPDRTFYKSQKIDGVSDIVKLSLVQNDTLFSETAFVMKDGATNGHDVHYDTRGLFNNYPIAPELFSLMDDIYFKINVFGEFPAVFPLELQFVEPGTATLDVMEMKDMGEHTEVILEDRELDEFYTLNSDFEGISFFADSGFISDRFFIHFNTTVGTDNSKISAISVYSDKNTVFVNGLSMDSDLSVYSLSGQMLYETRLQKNELNTFSLSLPDAYYIIRIVNEEKVITEKLFISK